MRQQGLISILGVLALIIIVLLGVGSYFMLRDRKAAEPSPTPGFQPATINKDEYNEGQVLVSFKSGTTFNQASEILFGFGLEFLAPPGVSGDQELSPTNIFRVTVEPGAEQATIDSLVTNSQVSAATLSYK